MKILRLLCVVASVMVAAATEMQYHTLGFISGNRNREGEVDTNLPGLRISGAFSLAVKDANRMGILPEGHRLDYLLAETHGSESESILQTAALWRKNVSAIIGPQETCVHEARMSASFDLPMISHFCPHQDTSDKFLYPTFARTRPPATFISKSILALLIKYNWTQIAFFHSNASDTEYPTVAAAVKEDLDKHRIKVKHVRQWNVMFHHGWGEPNFFRQWVKETKKDVRIYLLLGDGDNHLGLLDAMHAEGLFSRDLDDEYFVVGARLEPWSRKKSTRYLRGYLTQEGEAISPGVREGIHHYLGILSSPPGESSTWSYRNFTLRVKREMVKGPFRDLLSPTNVKLLKLRVEAAYLYDAVMLYAKALSQIISDNKTDGKISGRGVIDKIRGKSYRSALGYEMVMDLNGDPEGNYSLVAVRKNARGQLGLFPVGNFVQSGSSTSSSLPRLKFMRESKIRWPGGMGPPRAVPVCGFEGELCLTRYAERDLVLGSLGGVALVILVAAVVAYRNYRYEQQLDLLLWKIDSKDLSMLSSESHRGNRGDHEAASLASSCHNGGAQQSYRFGGRFVFARVCVYRGRLYACKRSSRDAVVVTRAMKKELKSLRDLRHDNVNAFVGACIDPGHVCVVTEYCARGSLRDILDNDDVRLDSMFVSSLVFDLVRGLSYLHHEAAAGGSGGGSGGSFHGNLKTANCLVDSR